MLSHWKIALAFRKESVCLRVPPRLILSKWKAIIIVERSTNFSPMKSGFFGCHEESTKIWEKRISTSNSERSYDINWLIKVVNTEMDEEHQIELYPKSYNFNLHRQLSKKYIRAMSDFWKLDGNKVIFIGHDKLMGTKKIREILDVLYGDHYSDSDLSESFWDSAIKHCNEIESNFFPSNMFVSS